MVNVLVDSLGKIYTDSTGKALSVSGGGGSATLITKTITENGTYNASSDSADGYSSVTVNVSGGSGESRTTIVPLTRISDDNGNEIGTWYMNFEDGSGNVFKVICLDAKYRSNSVMLSPRTVRNCLPDYYGSFPTHALQSKETATYNCDTMITNYGSIPSGIDFCRNEKFTIGGTVYEGQVPNAPEIFFMRMKASELHNLDTSSETAKNSYGFTHAYFMESSTRCGEGLGFILNTTGSFTQGNTTSSISSTDRRFCPILEIPII